MEGIVMKRNYFWGLLLIIIGLVFIANRFLNFDIPVSTIIISFALIYWGISIMTGKSPFHSHRHHHGEGEMLYAQGEIKGNAAQDKYDVIFSSSTVDLTTLPFPEKTRTIKIATIFSNSIIRINPDIPAIIKISSAFASAHVPNNTILSFGDYTYTTKGYKNGFPHLYIKADVVFGKMDIVEY